MPKERSAAQIKNDKEDRFALRFHGEGQRANIKDRAALNHRSMNAEILYLLEVGMGVQDARQ